MTTCLRLVTGLSVLLGTVTLVLADAPHAVTLRGDSFKASLSKIVDHQITWQSENDSRPTDIRELLHWGNLKWTPPRPEILLVDGSVLKLHRPKDLRIGDAHVTINDPFWGRVSLQRDDVAVIMLIASQDVTAYYKLRDSLRTDDSNAQEVVLLNGDILKGSVLNLTDIGLSVRASSRDVTVGVDRIQGFRLNSAPPIPTDRELVDVGLRDGSTLRGTVETLSASQLIMKLSCGTTVQARLHAKPLREVVFLRPLTRNVINVSRLQPIGYKHIPFLSLEWPYRTDRNVQGGPLRAGGELFDTGIGMHSTSRLAFDLPAGCERFEAELAIDESTGGLGSVTFRVFVDRDTKWQGVFQSPIVRAGDSPLSCRVDLVGARRIALVVDFADRGDQGDHANWLNARIIRTSNVR